MLGFLSRFVDSNDRELRRIEPLVERTNELEPEMQEKTDAEIRELINEIREEIRAAAEPEEPSEEERHSPDLERRRELARDRRDREHRRLQDAMDEALPDVFAAAREAMQRTLGMRHFDVQLLGGVVLHQGRIAEMKTGEGKTLVPTLAAALNALTGHGVHVVTVNDYLARRDAQWMGPVYHFLGLSVGIIVGARTSSGQGEAYVFEPGYPTSDERLLNLRPCSRREAYEADITYGTNNEFGFDYLRDNMVVDLEQRVQRERYFAIVDEVDNILIDEARTPLIISGQAEESADKYYRFARLVPRLVARPEGAEEGGDYFVDLKEKAVSPTEEGIEKMERMLGVKNLYDEDPTLARHFESALKAHALYKRDRDYIVKDGEIVIVDEFTGRQMPGRRWSEGLHQAIEAKEGLRVQRENVTLATITFQNYFRLYTKLSGMTGTAMTEAEELHKIYKLEVVAVPTHRPMIREDHPDLVFRNEKGKFEALIDEIADMHEQGRPVLVGTVSVEKSELLGSMLARRGIKHEVLNAKFHEKEAPIVAQAGRTGAVTIATNMAGRGTDILLGGNPAGLTSEMLRRKGLNPAEVDKETYDATFAEAKKICDDDHERVVEAGGLHIIGTERHDSRRIDNQLRGRAGRQGDPGSSRFYLSLEDDLMKRFASERVAGLMERLGLDEDMAIESRLVSKTIESAQTRVEGYNFDIRKRVVEYDDVINKQRETVYEERDKVLRNEDLTDTIEDFVDQEIDILVDKYLPQSLAPKDWDYTALSQGLVAMGLGSEETTPEKLDEVGLPQAVSLMLKDLVADKLAQKDEENAEEWALIERLVLLRTIDSIWIEHLTEIDEMRQGIGLRGFAQEDPINAFKREAFSLYQEMQTLIRHQVATTIFRVQLVRQQPPGQPGDGTGGNGTAGDRTDGDGAGDGTGGNGTAAQAGRQPPKGQAGRGAAPRSGQPAARGLPRAMPAGRQSGGSGGADAAGSGAIRPGYSPAGVRMGRNDQCWCGSRLKYKKCHGR
jgi:preprotein translocase subunit SecA